MSRSVLVFGLLSAFGAVALSAGSPSVGGAAGIRLKLRTRVQPFPAQDSWTEANFEQSFEPRKTAIVITDMWDRHWCRGATLRVDGIARRMEPVIEKARDAGILIIHAPSDTMDFYAGTPGRKLAEGAPPVKPPAEADLQSPPLPIDDSDGGCDTPGDHEHRVWTRETPLLTMAPGDVVSDSGREIYNVLEQRGVDTIFYMGVHANMCILNRTFGIRQMSGWGMRCVLVRDLTDAMYDSASRPFVSHAAGTELVIEYIERHWAPTVTSAQLMEALP